MAPITDIKQLDPNGIYTYADYLTWKFDTYVELFKGKVLRMSPAPSRRHQKVVGVLHGHFYNFFRKSPCSFYVAPFDVRLPALKNDKEILTVLQPDLCIICDPEKLDERGCLGAPDLVVEVLSEGNSKKEMRLKFKTYEEAGVREYWIVHPYDNIVMRYQLNEQGFYVGLPPLVEDDILTTNLFPGLEIDLTEVFEE